MNNTHTYATLEVSQSSFDDIKQSIANAGESYTARYIDSKDGQEIIHWGGEIGLVVNCDCIDCGGDKNGHKSTCSYMEELVGDRPRIDIVAKRNPVKLNHAMADWIENNMGGYMELTSKDVSDFVNQLRNGEFPHLDANVVAP